MIEVKEAIKIIKSNLKPKDDIKTINIINSINRVSAQDIYSPIDSPPFDRSPYDGYAYDANINGNELVVVGEVYAGDVYEGVLHKNESVKIMTGAKIPNGANCVIKKEDVSIISEDKIIVNKPAGQLSQSARGFDMDLVSEVLTYRKNKGEEAYAAIINRLDRPVSGLVLIAKNKKEAARLSALMQRESLCKQYLVLVCGRPHSDTGTFTDYLLKNSKDNTSKVVSKEQAGAKKAVLEYSLIDYDDERNVSRLLINLITGRHHQIRVQLSSRNLPVVGDGKYGGNPAVKKAEEYHIKRGCIALCAKSLTVDGKVYEIEPEFSGGK